MTTSVTAAGDGHVMRTAMAIDSEAVRHCITRARCLRAVLPDSGDFFLRARAASRIDRQALPVQSCSHTALGAELRRLGRVTRNHVRVQGWFDVAEIS
jgi:hypothetical protein